MADTATWIRAVRSSLDRFGGLLRPLTAAEVEGPSYNRDWSIADTASHLGSQAEIFGLFLDAGLSGAPAPGGEVFGGIWDRWNALAPAEQVRRSVEANEALVARIEQTTDEERDAFALSALGRELDLTGLVGMRLAELALHTWDVAVALDPSATVSDDAVDLLVDELPAVAARAGKADDGEPVAVVTTDPDRTFALDLGDPVTLRPSAAAGRRAAGAARRGAAPAGLRTARPRPHPGRRRRPPPQPPPGGLPGLLDRDRRRGSRAAPDDEAGGDQVLAGGEVGDVDPLDGAADGEPGQRVDVLADGGEAGPAGAGERAVVVADHADVLRPARTPPAAARPSGRRRTGR